jgi:hypothetical protein
MFVSIPNLFACKLTERAPKRRSDSMFRADVERFRKEFQAFHNACLTNSAACYKTQQEKLDNVCALADTELAKMFDVEVCEDM